MRQTTPKNYKLVSTEPRVTLQNPDGHDMTIEALSPHVFRVRFVPTTTHSSLTHVHANHTTFDMEPRAEIRVESTFVEIKTDALVSRISCGENMSLSWYTKDAIIAEDLPDRAYSFDRGSGCVYHYLKRSAEDRYYGLGERTGDINLHGRRFRLQGVDAMGYNAQSTDPLYKFCPFYITLVPDGGNGSIAYGMFYNTFAETCVDLGQELDAMLGPYRYVQIEAGPLDYFFIYGPTIRDVVLQYAYLQGTPHELIPRFALGYLASSMGYAEAENAQELLAQFPAQCRAHGIPCDGMHLSSGYTVNSTTGDRCVFTWNKQRFPDPSGLFRSLKEQGVRVFANIKPYLMTRHPSYEELAHRGGFVRDGTGPGIVLQWRAGRGESGKASYIDFTSHRGYNWWVQQCREQLLEVGVEGLWNDNNEYTMQDDGHTFAMENLEKVSSMLYCPVPNERAEARIAGPSLQTLMMARASYEALKLHFPNRRPFLITRSATPFIYRFACQTWSGDNYTNWTSLRYNLPMGLGAALSVMPGGYGHDVGGFAGPRPEPELFIRWVQNGVLHPRFCIHSWNSDGTITEPWTHPEIVPVVRMCLELRYRFIPYLYEVHREHFERGEPVLRPTFYHFQEDENTWDNSFDFMIGRAVLVPSVLDKGVETRDVYLPKGKDGLGWFDFRTGLHYESGHTITLKAPLMDLPPILVLEGGIIPTGPVMPYISRKFDTERVIYIFPSRTKRQFEYTLTEDDGETMRYEQGERMTLKIEMISSEEDVQVSIRLEENNYRPPYEVVWFALPKEDKRPIKVEGYGAGMGENVEREEEGRRQYGIRIL
ncbi:uncharacterized protein VTP21DRAFT_564 [Calcarisporiella thermophila]|uniref:uncharacterized protein n=1 Tax=Calcarisporiella thermophila TaxID=911321 RepID=UPI0037425743